MKDIMNNEIQELRIKLEKISKEKEEWFKKKEDLKRIISKKINEMRSIKSSKDQSNINSQSLKNKKYNIREEINTLIKKIKETDKKKKELIQKLNIKFDPYEIKNNIERLEMKIQTDVISFEEEKKIMKHINELKKKLKESAAVSKIMEEKNKISKQIDEKRDEFKDVLNKLKELQPQNNYEEFFNTSKELESIKKEQEEAFNKFIEKKKEYSDMIHQIKSKLLIINDIKNKQYKNNQNKLKKKKEQDTEILKRKSKDVEEKLKNRQKLTTEDLMVYQKTNS